MLRVNAALPDQPVLLDITRLIGRAHRAGPSGIDRIELAYARHFLLDGAAVRPAYPVIHLRGWLFGVNPDAARRFVAGVAQRWQGHEHARRSGSRLAIARLYLLLLGGHWMAGWQLRRRLRRHSLAPVYLVVSHHHLAFADRLESIRRTYGARLIAFLHDLIPVDFPEYVEPAAAQRHRRILDTVSRCCDGIIVNSQTTAAHFRHFLARRPDACVCSPVVHVALPGVLPLPRGTHARTAADGVPYFVIVGTIEPKKNHLLLLNLWALLSDTLASPPRLHVVGARGWENEQAVDMLERSVRLQGLVEEHGDLDDGEVGALLAGARAVLLPSFVEGFGLPLAEALAAGVPVVCSDIDAFREVGGDAPEFLSPFDLPAWRDAVLDYAAPDSARRAAQLERLGRWSAPSWAGHFAVVRSALEALDPAVGRGA